MEVSLTTGDCSNVGITYTGLLSKQLAYHTRGSTERHQSHNKIPLLERRPSRAYRISLRTKNTFSLQMRTHYKYQETVGYIGSMALSTNFCPECNIIHVHSHPPVICTTHFNHDPRIIELLEKWDTWRLGIQAAVIGCDAFYYLPREQKFHY
jgi:hypothetical protein